MGGSELGEIDSIIANLKQRVLLNETLNNFKKEISVIADLIDRRDSTFTSTYANNVAQKLTTVLPKQSQVEILFMLQRTSLLEKRKKKKVELDKNTQLAKQITERDLKNQNKRADNDFLEIDKLDPQTSKFAVLEDLSGLLVNQIMKNVTDFVSIHNEYLIIKGNEEKAKVIQIIIYHAIIVLSQASEA